MLELVDQGLKITPDIYDVVSEERIVFYDHAKYSKHPLKCTVWGLVVFECDLYIVVSWWDTNTDCKEEREDNAEFMCILKSAIIERRKIEHGKAFR